MSAEDGTYNVVARNVNGAFIDTLWWLNVAGLKEQSRNGPVLVAPGPVCITYKKPLERVLFNPKRDANPYFHLFESLWMLAGRNDVAFVAQFAKRMADFSDNGATLNGAYGHRWRKYFKWDQIEGIIQLLRKDPNTRRAVLTMWDGAADLWDSGVSIATSKDVPCNLMALFDLRNGALNMTVLNRSNDLVWGALGSNVVHFSILQEYIAHAVSNPVGVYRQFSNNLHLYTERHTPHDLIYGDREDPYAMGTVEPSPLMQTEVRTWETDLRRFMADPLGDCGYADPFFYGVAAPMYASWTDRRSKNNDGSLAAQSIVASDWREACLAWITRRETKSEA
jgi:hypothetical protein